jgi:hypothetical protein
MMAAPTPEAIIEYLRRSYTAADGLWFMAVEEDSSFDHALALDSKVWRILAKIQARRAKELLALRGGSLDDLLAGLALKFAAEDYAYRVEQPAADHALVMIDGCPWLRLLQKSGREAVAATVAREICPVDFGAWAREFGPGLRAQVGSTLCEGHVCCEVTLALEGA